jgi:hypothetical protein
VNAKAANGEEKEAAVPMGLATTTPGGSGIMT